jgi:alanine racemase
LPTPPAPSLRLRIDRRALVDNWRALDLLSGTARAGAAVKADAYGLGVDAVMPVLLEAGARDFFVAHWSEVPAVLAHAEASRIAVLHGPITEEDAAFARATGVRPVINSPRQAQLWLEAGGGPCDLMVDTGINRLGIAPADIPDPAIAALDIHTCHSHLASADEDSPFNAAQLRRFRDVRGQVRAREFALANSAGIALGKDYAFDLTRPGLSIYGGIARPEMAEKIRQVVYPEAAIIQLRDLKPGETVGYNATFTAQREIRAATVSLGYADGILRNWAPAAALRHDGRELPVLGKISMDMVVVDCGDAQELREGDFLAFEYDLPRASEITGLSQYELLTVLGSRFARTV